MTTKTKNLTPKEAADFLAIHPETLRQYQSAGYIESEKTKGGHRRYAMDALEELKARINEGNLKTDQEPVKTLDLKNDSELGGPATKLIGYAIKGFKRILNIDVLADELSVQECEEGFNGYVIGTCAYKIDTGTDFGFLVYDSEESEIFYTANLNRKAKVKITSAQGIQAAIREDSRQNGWKAKTTLAVLGVLTILPIVISSFFIAQVELAALFPVVPCMLTACSSIFYALKLWFFPLARITDFKTTKSMKPFIDGLPDPKIKKHTLVFKAGMASEIKEPDELFGFTLLAACLSGMAFLLGFLILIVVSLIVAS